MPEINENQSMPGPRDTITPALSRQETQPRPKGTQISQTDRKSGRSKRLVRYPDRPRPRSLPPVPDPPHRPHTPPIAPAPPKRLEAHSQPVMRTPPSPHHGTFTSLLRCRLSRKRSTKPWNRPAAAEFGARTTDLLAQRPFSTSTDPRSRDVAERISLPCGPVRFSGAITAAGGCQIHSPSSAAATPLFCFLTASTMSEVKYFRVRPIVRSATWLWCSPNNWMSRTM